LFVALSYPLVFFYSPVVCGEPPNVPRNCAHTTSAEPLAGRLRSPDIRLEQSAEGVTDHEYELDLVITGDVERAIGTAMAVLTTAKETTA
jgi:hypothetical protein